MEKPRFLGVFGIIAAIEIPFINPSFIAYTFITSLPLFCVMILPKLSFVPRIIKKTVVLLDLPDSHSKNKLMFGPSVNLSELTKFLVAFTVIASVSKLYGALELGGQRLSEIFFKTPATEEGPFSSMRKEWEPPLQFFTLLGFTFLRDGFSAWWQMALVVSVLEEDKLQLDAFSASWKLRKGNRFTGFVLMVLYFGWHCLLLVLKSFNSGVGYACVDIGLFCLGTIMNWVACTVYYHDCKNRQRREEVTARED